MGPALAARAALGDDVVYVTNNAMHYHADYLPRLAGHGAPVGPDRVITSARASALYVRDHMPSVRRVLAVGAAGLERELREAGFDVVTAAHAATRMSQEGLDGWAAAEHPDAVVVGLDPQLTYLRIAGYYFNHNAPDPYAEGTLEISWSGGTCQGAGTYSIGGPSDPPVTYNRNGAFYAPTSDTLTPPQSRATEKTGSPVAL